MVRKKVLVLSFFPVFFPSKSGGELRLYNVCKNLSKYYDVTILSFTYPNPDKTYQKIALLPNVTEIRIPKGKVHEILHYIFSRFGHISESSGVVVSLASRGNKNYNTIFAQLVKESHIIISTHPYLYKNIDDKVVIYESYNMEYFLQKKAFGNSIIAKMLSRYVYYIEKNACSKSDLIFAVSKDDMNDFHDVYNMSFDKMSLAPNGVATKEIQGCLTKNVYKKRLNLGMGNVVLFIGSAHPPNIDAATKIIEELAPNLEEITFVIAGKVSEYISTISTSNKSNSNSQSYHFPDVGEYALLTHGWYTVEDWGSIATRWTEKAFGFAAKDTGISKIFLKMLSPKNTSVDIYLNDENLGHTELESDVWTNIKFEFDPVDDVNLNLVVGRTFKERGGSRILGVAVQNVGYEAAGLEKKILEDSHKIWSASSGMPPNVKILGVISDQMKHELLNASDAAVNPQTYGSGTNLKMLEYFAAELPVITTPIGARGIDIVNGTHAIICDFDEFKDNLVRLFRDKTLYDQLKKNGRDLVVFQYDWEKIVDNMYKDIEIIYEKKNSSNK